MAHFESNYERWQAWANELGMNVLTCLSSQSDGLPYEKYNARGGKDFSGETRGIVPIEWKKIQKFARTTDGGNRYEHNRERQNP